MRSWGSNRVNNLLKATLLIGVNTCTRTQVHVASEPMCLTWHHPDSTKTVFGWEILLAICKDWVGEEEMEENGETDFKQEE